MADDVIEQTQTDASNPENTEVQDTQGNGEANQGGAETHPQSGESTPEASEPSETSQGQEGEKNPEASEESEGDSDKPDDSEDTGESDVSDGDTSDTEFDGKVTVKFNDVDLDITVPQELTDALKDKGINVADVIDDLYSSDEFTLNEANYAALSEIYGKSMLDSYLGALKAQNTLAVQNYQKAIDDKAALDKQVWDETVKQVGGEDNWTMLEAYALKSFSDEQLGDFNDVMANGTRYAQKLAIDALMHEYRDNVGEMKVTLVDADTSNREQGNSYLTKDQYLELHRSGKYKEDPERYDAMRRKGQQLGR